VWYNSKARRRTKDTCASTRKCTHAGAQLPSSSNMLIVPFPNQRHGFLRKLIVCVQEGRRGRQRIQDTYPSEVLTPIEEETFSK